MTTNLFRPVQNLEMIIAFPYLILTTPQYLRMT